jgi:hypothetical protein
MLFKIVLSEQPIILVSANISADAMCTLNRGPCRAIVGSRPVIILANICHKGAGPLDKCLDVV